jgi:hypothetical protein
MSLEDRCAGATGGRKEPAREDAREPLARLAELYEAAGRLIERLQALDLPTDSQARQAFQATLKEVVDTAYEAGNELALYQAKAEELLKAGPLASHALFRSLSYAGLTPAELRTARLPPAKLSTLSIAFEHCMVPFHARYGPGGTLTLSTADPKDEQALRLVANSIDFHHGGQPFSQPRHLQSRIIMEKNLDRLPTPAECADALERLYVKYYSKACIDEARYVQVTREEYLDAGIPHERLAHHEVD